MATNVKVSSGRYLESARTTSKAILARRLHRDFLVVGSVNFELEFGFCHEPPNLQNSHKKIVAHFVEEKPDRNQRV